jgi:hypothetical protein
MPEFAPVKESSDTTHKRKAPEQNKIRPLTIRPYAPPVYSVIQRVPLCACDGGCPRCLSPVQAKLTIGKPNDEYEQEADRVAEQVMSMPDTNCPECAPEKEEGIQAKPLSERITPLVQRQEEDDEEEPTQAKTIDGSCVQRQDREPDEDDEEEPVLTKPLSNQTPAAGNVFNESLASLDGLGHPLPEKVRTYFEPRFGADFGNVRVYADSNAAQTAKSINAKAFTKGTDIVFGENQYSPDSSPGKNLLAHELTHVIQQKKKYNSV